MVRNILKYGGIALVIVGVLLVMKNLFTKDNELSDDDLITYSVKVKLLDKDSNEYVSGAKMVLRDENNEIVEEWITTDKAYVVDDLHEGEYILVQEGSVENYHLNTEVIKFKVSDSDKSVVMYNVRMTDEEIKDANTVEEDVNVDNTLSNKNILTLIISGILFTLGFGLIFKVRKGYK